MPRSNIAFTTLTAVALCFGHATATRADFIPFTGSFQNFNNPPAAPDVGRCGAAPPNLLVSPTPGGGTANLGAFTVTGSFCTDIITGVQSNGLFSFDFAGGNTFFGTQSGTTGQIVNGFATNFFTFSITGGTGLFNDATGTLSGPGTVTFLPGGFTNGTANLSGTINTEPDPNTVPEPTTMLLLGTAFAAVASKVCSRRNASEGEV